MPDLPPSIYVPVVGALAAVIAFQNKVTIPGIVKELRESNAGYLNWSQQTAPVLAKAIELIEKCREGCPFGDHRKHKGHAEQD